MWKRVLAIGLLFIFLITLCGCESEEQKRAKTKERAEQITREYNQKKKQIDAEIKLLESLLEVVEDNN